MEIYYGARWRSAIKSIDETFFIQLTEVFHDRPQPPTLRELKELFPDVKLEQMIERMIKAKLIKRQDRRYFLQVPTYHNEMNQEQVGWLGKAVSSLKKLPLHDRLHLLVELGSCSEDGTELYVVQGAEYTSYQESMTETLSCRECTRGTKQETILSFFRANQIHSNFHDHRYDYIGDVNPGYYFDQIEVILEKIYAKRTRIRSTIFTRSLIDFHFIKEEASQLKACLEVEGNQLKSEKPAFIKTFTEFPMDERHQLMSALFKEFKLNAIQEIHLKNENVQFYAYF